jgi:hypothetical protein
MRSAEDPDDRYHHRLRDESDTYDVHPALTDAPVWLGWDQSAGERLLAGDPDDPTVVADDTEYVIPPDGTVVDGTRYVAWTEGDPDGEWRVVVSAGFDSPEVVARATDAQYASVSVAATSTRLYLAVEEVAEDVRVRIFGRPIAGGTWSERSRTNSSSYQPRVAAREEQAGVVYSTFSGRGYDVHYRDVNEGETTVVSADGVYNASPDLAFGPDGKVWVAWTRESERMNPNREHYLRDHVRVQTTERFSMVAPWYNHQRAFVRRLDRDVYTRLGSPEHRNAHYPRISVGPSERPWVFTRYLAAPNRDLDVPKYGVFGHRGPAPDGPAGGHGAWADPVAIDDGHAGRNGPVGVVPTAQGFDVTWSVDSRPTVGGDLGEADSGSYISDTRFVRTDDAIRHGESDLVTLTASEEALGTAPTREGESAYAVAPRHVERKPVSTSTETDVTVETSGGEFELLYGNLHRHSTISMCGSDFDQGQQFHYRFARDVTGEAFTAVTDHAEDMVPYDWHESVKYAEVHDAPGSFVAFPAYEFTGSRQIYADYRGDDEGYGHAHVIQREPGHERRHIYEAETPTVQALLDAVDPEVTLPIPHHPADMQFPWDWTDYDDEVAPVVELYQDYRGSSERPDDPRHVELPQTEETHHYVQAALDSGVHVGLISSGDHYSVSFGGVYAADRTRDAIFEALKARRCFATTGAKIVLDFRADGELMGSVLDTAATEVTFEGRIDGDGVLDTVELVGNGEVCREWSPETDTFTFEVVEDAPDPGYYYLRAHRVDEHMAWSSPIWLEGDG